MRCGLLVTMVIPMMAMTMIITIENASVAKFAVTATIATNAADDFDYDFDYDFDLFTSIAIMMSTPMITLTMIIVSCMMIAMMMVTTMNRCCRRW